MNYINKTIKQISEQHLKSVLKKLNEKLERERQERLRDIYKAFADGFRCGERLNGGQR